MQIEEGCIKTVRTILKLANEYLTQRSIYSPRRVAETLLSAALGLKRIELYMEFDRPLIDKELTIFREHLKRAVLGEPVEYILGEVEFFNCTVRLSQATLIPRLETEILIDLVSKNLPLKAKRVLDLCTGSGCLAAALKQAYPHLEVTGVDLSGQALEIAKTNSRKVRWLQGDLTCPILGERFDLVLCNPPYVAEQDYDKLDRSVRDFEPKMALVSGPTGLEFYERLTKELPLILSPGAMVYFEIGMGQGKAVRKIFKKECWTQSHIEKDWSGHDRFFWLSLKEFSPIMKADDNV